MMMVAGIDSILSEAKATKILENQRDWSEATMTATQPKKRGRPKKMSDATLQLNETVKPKSVAKKKVFDLEKFEKVSKEVEYLEPEPLTTLDQVLQLDEAKALEYVNLGLARDAWKTARKSIAGVSPKIINQFTNVFRQLPPHSEIADRKEQTASIYNFIRSQEAILNSLKLAAASAPADDEDDDEDGDEQQ